MTGLTLGVLGRTLLDADLGAFGAIGHSFEAVQDQAMFEMVTLALIPMWLPLPEQLRFRRARATWSGWSGSWSRSASARPAEPATT